MIYDQLDNAILTAIAGGTRSFYLINAAVEHLAKPHGHGMHDTFRVVDRRLQALRKRGLIEFRKKEWHMSGRVDRNTAQK